MTNSTPIIMTSPKLSDDQQACVDLLADALENATNGRISAVAIVVCMDDGIAPAMAGKNAGGLNCGLDQLKHQIRAALFEDGNLARRKSGIVRAR